MRFKLTLLVVTVAVLWCGNIFAAEPIINYNVPVLQNTTADHCPASWEGETGDDVVTDISGYGMDSGVATAGIQSCSDCAYDSKSHSCICKTCYGYYN